MPHPESRPVTTLELLRIQRGETKSSLARRLGIGRSTLKRYERGELGRVLRNPGRIAVAKLETYFEEPATKLLSFISDVRIAGTP